MFNKEEYVRGALNCVWDQLTNMGYELVYLVVQGSTNYNLDVYTDEYMSDVDMKCFVMPTFDDLYTGNKVSKVYQTGYGQVEVKDLRLLPDLLGKMNSSYLELLFTPYFLVDTDYQEYLLEMRLRGEDLVEQRFPLLMKTMMGMALEKQNALCHEYEGLKDKLEKFGGYDPKQLHHAMRLLSMMSSLASGSMYSDVLEFNGPEREKLLDVKVHGVGSKERAVAMMEGVVSTARRYYEMFWDGKTPKRAVSSNTLHRMEDLVRNMVKVYFVGEVHKD